MVWELIYHIRDHQIANRVEQNNKKKKEEENRCVFNHSQLGLKRPLIFWTR